MNKLHRQNQTKFCDILQNKILKNWGGGEVKKRFDYFLGLKSIYSDHKKNIFKKLIDKKIKPNSLTPSTFEAFKFEILAICKGLSDEANTSTKKRLAKKDVENAKKLIDFVLRINEILDFEPEKMEFEPFKR